MDFSIAIIFEKQGLICFNIYPFLADFDECSSNPCQNGGICNDDVNKYTCICPPIWIGTNCETGEFVVPFPLIVSRDM